MASINCFSVSIQRNRVYKLLLRQVFIEYHIKPGFIVITLKAFKNLVLQQVDKIQGHGETGLGRGGVLRNNALQAVFRAIELDQGR